MPKQNIFWHCKYFLSDPRCKCDLSVPKCAMCNKKISDWGLCEPCYNKDGYYFKQEWV